ncbi:hypothetical protein BT67DRAFT_433810 [Trichocladium antarcticum]|uniref:Activator of Hsp90 ATPase AHSA1-like N-terminal domain-containing protein n=1 Tax=Trichocladium antarcticum TaxID=1450529 RepID=A0AAN6UNK9_9PEZI|nr:hypothetical protein BT67DRAFT_433810 [Trichocladium antarcticum]
MVLHNPNNWHWVNKDVSPWAKQWFEDNLTKLEAKEGDVTAKISKVVSMDGDCDVAQRKGKVITIFDVKLTLEYTGSTAEDDDVSGTITVPEVSHELTEDEFVFDIDVHADSKEKQAVKDLVRSKLLPQLRGEFVKLQPAMIAEHGKDLQHAPGSNPSSGFSTPKYHPPTGAAVKEAPTSSAQTKTGRVINTTTVTDNEEFRTTAAELYQTFTDPQRLAAFTRAPPKVFEGAKQGGKFELFDGNVTGEYLELQEPTKIVQSWRLNQWPAGHYSKLQIEFDQNDVDSVTVMRVEWTGVPVGQEEVTKRNWLEYYQSGAIKLLILLPRNNGLCPEKDNGTCLQDCCYSDAAEGEYDVIPMSGIPGRQHRSDLLLDVAVDENLAKAESYIRQAASQGAHLAVLPEYHLTSWCPDHADFIAACAASAAHLPRYQALARDLHINIVPGTICHVMERQNWNTTIRITRSRRARTQTMAFRQAPGPDTSSPVGGGLLRLGRFFPGESPPLVHKPPDLGAHLVTVLPDPHLAAAAKELQIVLVLAGQVDRVQRVRQLVCPARWGGPWPLPRPPRRAVPGGLAVRARRPAS